MHAATLPELLDDWTMMQVFGPLTVPPVEGVHWNWFPDWFDAMVSCTTCFAVVHVQRMLRQPGTGPA
jgi:hypothetical protein